jgi:hypothetical protein
LHHKRRNLTAKPNKVKAIVAEKKAVQRATARRRNEIAKAAQMVNEFAELRAAMDRFAQLKRPIESEIKPVHAQLLKLEDRLRWLCTNREGEDGVPVWRRDMGEEETGVRQEIIRVKGCLAEIQGRLGCVLHDEKETMSRLRGKFSYALHGYACPTTHFVY